MKHDTSGLDLARLTQLIRDAYDLDIATITFLPCGEEAYTYLAVDRRAGRHFVRVQSRERAAALEQVYGLLARLQAQHGWPEILAAYHTRGGPCTVPLECFILAVFPFVQGVSGFVRPFTDARLAELARFLARLHRVEAPPGSLRRETFDDPFEEPICRALAWSEEGVPPSEYQRLLRELLRREAGSIHAALERMRAFQVELSQQEPAWCLTHGDLNLDNVLLAGDGTLHVTDWGGLALGPPERDLTHQVGPRLAFFLQHYLQAGGPSRLHAELFSFYDWRWTVQEIADWTARILSGNAGEEEQGHAWHQLQQYLPLPLEAMEARRRRTEQVLDALCPGVDA